MHKEHAQVVGDTNTEPKRVKVYILEDNEWKDTGTGFCIGQYEHAAASAYLVVRDEDQPDRVLLKSKLEGNIEYQRQEETLIVWKDIQGQDIALSFEESMGCNALCDFICQVQKTLENNISLVSVRSNEDGMGSVHEIITGPVHLPSNDLVQNEGTLMESLRILNKNTALEFLKNETVEFLVNSNYLDTLLTHFQIAEEKQLHRDLLLLSHIIKTLFLYNQREILELLIDDDHYLGVVGILEYDTEYPDCKANHRRCLQETKTTFKEVIPLNDENMRQTIKKTFRLQFLKDVVLVRFLDDHSSNLITDVMLNYQTTIIHFLQKGRFIDELVGLYAGNPNTTDPDLLEKKRQGIKLLDECVQISCNLDSPDRSTFYKSLVKKGLFNVLDFAFNVETNSEIRILATDMIISIIEHDILLINSVHNEMMDHSLDEEHSHDNNNSNNNGNHHSTNDDDDDNNNNSNSNDNNNSDSNNNIPGENNDKLPTTSELHVSNGVTTGADSNNNSQVQQHSSDISLLLILSKILLTDKSPGLKEQAFQALVTLLDPEDFMGEDYEDQSSIESLVKFYANSKLRDKSTGPQYQLMEYFNKFYKQVAPVLFHILISGDIENRDDQLLLRLVKLVDLLVHEHDIMLSRGFVLENGVLITISRFIEPKHIPQLRLAALRCIKGVVMLNDDFYSRYLISKNLFDPIFQLLQENLYLDNTANSCVLDFLKFVSTQCYQSQEVSDFNKKNYIMFNKYLVDRFGNLLSKVDYVPFPANMIRMSRNDNFDGTTTADIKDTEDGFLESPGEDLEHAKEIVNAVGDHEDEDEENLGMMDSSLIDESDSDSDGEDLDSTSNGVTTDTTPNKANQKRPYSDLEDNQNGLDSVVPQRRLSLDKIKEIPVLPEKTVLK
ncbi:Psy2p Ecym_6445 [Eremothecium cymbalariae DBVPG|uniref:Serine/threonine-protein phosphatase 4 regulatory subunit 3 n=1 Tax=Eremothecium cymbalariae (strain CBS 270.75 / DBVPG 7215 / KCTC 17166 / NRRL Y-17582) TaxID=931890 RepID=G8JUN6_ERECY|nr:hypothetical protein Ecym_6445 [Eremothecium cymbalariae DBVPG\